VFTRARPRPLSKSALFLGSQYNRRCLAHDSITAEFAYLCK